MTLQTNLPTVVEQQVTFFNGTNNVSIGYSPNNYEIIAGIFRGLGFEKDSVETMTFTILAQCKVLGMSVADFAVQLGKSSAVELNRTLAEFLNLNRLPTSLIGYKTRNTPNELIRRTVRF